MSSEQKAAVPAASRMWSGGAAWLAAVLVTLAAGVAACAPEDGVLKGEVTVIDGDSLELNGAQIRLEGIDAPEFRQKCKDTQGDLYQCGGMAAAELNARIGDGDVLCKSTSKDEYGRLLATCHSGGENLNEWMVREGWALAYRRYSSRYVEVESQAKTSGKGIWSGEFVPPERWRRGERLAE